ncbi:hypothetical protein RMN56_30495 [Micromonospora halotolerans]|uniref:Cell division protein CrgA n=1 Tax=Micromonospora halotolerans TaxID=709879 RepID=A0ABY9ZXS8_9ACTN|nr:hypothetical protein [Micromonospora halotolerans]WNM39390.1 hypothetical protein RMN56_30495 [Micromonospora halotolerans]
MTVLPAAPSPQPPADPGGTRAMSLAVVFLAALLVASWTGFIVWLSTHQLADAILRGGMAFAGAVGLSLAVWTAYRQK